MDEFFNTVIGVPLGYVMYWCMELLKNYGLAIIAFTFISKIVFLPITFWVQKNSIKMVKMKPELNFLEAKYIFDKDTFIDKQLEVYKREKYNAFAGIIPLLLQIPLILGLINVIYNPFQHLLHMDAEVIAAFETVTQEILQLENLGSSPQLRVVEVLGNSENMGSFLALQSQFPDVDIQQQIADILALNMNFLGVNLASVATLSPVTWIIPILAGLSSLLMCALQNRVNVLQIEQGFWGKWGMAIFLTLFSLYFGFVVSAGVGLYWIVSNLFSILIMYFVNFVSNPKKYIDYEKLEESKIVLKKAKEQVPKKKFTLFDNSPEHKKEVEDYKHFMHVPEEDMKIVFYSEQSGFYKYFEGYINEILATSDYSIHYITSDYNDKVFTLNNDRIKPYYIGENKLITLMMKMTADVVVMTMPDLQNYHIKRSLVRSDVKYVFASHGMDSPNLTTRKGSLNNYDVILCVGEHTVSEHRAIEELYGLKKRKLIKCGYPLLDDMIAAYESTEHIENEVPTVLIAPSWQPDNVVDSCLDELLSELQKSKYNIVVRPHPQHIRHRKEHIDALAKKYESENSNIRFETDFSSNSTVFNADLLITDWSGIAFEYAYTTLKPVLFINTPMKIMNEDYDKIPVVPMNILVRSELGTSLDLDKLSETNATIDHLFDNREQYKEKILACREKYVFHIGESKKVGARNILKQVKK